MSNPDSFLTVAGVLTAWNDPTIAAQPPIRPGILTMDHTTVPAHTSRIAIHCDTAEECSAAALICLVDVASSYNPKNTTVHILNCGTDDSDPSLGFSALFLPHVEESVHTPTAAEVAERVVSLVVGHQGHQHLDAASQPRETAPRRTILVLHQFRRVFDEITAWHTDPAADERAAGRKELAGMFLDILNDTDNHEVCFIETCPRTESVVPGAVPVTVNIPRLLTIHNVERTGNEIKTLSALASSQN